MQNPKNKKKTFSSISFLRCTKVFENQSFQEYKKILVFSFSKLILEYVLVQKSVGNTYKARHSKSEICHCMYNENFNQIMAATPNSINNGTTTAIFARIESKQVSRKSDAKHLRLRQASKNRQSLLTAVRWCDLNWSKTRWRSSR